MLTPERRAMYRRIIESSDREFTAKAIGQMLADLDEKDALIAKLSERVAAQSELLSRKAEPPLFDRLDCRISAIKEAWDILHELLDCGHPRACWMDRNYPASEQSYNPATKTSDPHIDYRCVACESQAALRAERDAWAEAAQTMAPHIGDPEDLEEEITAWSKQILGLAQQRDELRAALEFVVDTERFDSSSYHLAAVRRAKHALSRHTKGATP